MHLPSLCSKFSTAPHSTTPLLRSGIESATPTPNLTKTFFFLLVISFVSLLLPNLLIALTRKQFVSFYSGLGFRGHQVSGGLMTTQNAFF